MVLREAIEAKKAWNLFVYDFNIDDTDEQLVHEDIKKVADALDHLVTSLGGKKEDVKGYYQEDK